MAGEDIVAEMLLIEFEALKRDRDCLNSFYEAATYHFNPLAAHFWCNDLTQYPKINFNGGLMTSVGVSSLNRLGNFLMGNGTPPSSKWLDLQDANEDISTRADVADFWATSTKRVAKDMRGLPGMQSSFYIAMREAYKNMGISYGVVHVSEYLRAGNPTGHVVYEAVQPHAFWYRTGAHGEMVACAHARNVTNDQLKGFIDKNAIKMVGSIDTASRSTEKSLIVQMVKANYDPSDTPRDASEFPFQEYWIDVKERKVLLKTGHRSQPFHVMGWNGVVGSDYFVGPAYDALPDLNGATAARKAQLQVMAWNGRPPLLAGSKDGFENPQKTLVPGRITFGAIGSDGKAMIQPMTNGANSGVFQYAVADDEARVRESMMGNELLSQRRPDMTATEVMQVAQERAQMVAPFMITTMPAIKGMIMRHFEILLRLGKLPEVPDAVAQEGGFDAAINGPLAIAARQAETGSIFETLQMIGQVAQFNPSAARRLNIEEITDAIGVANGTISLLHDWSKVEGEMKQEAQAQAQVAEAEIAQSQAQATGAGAEAMGAMQQVMGGMQ